MYELGDFSVGGLGGAEFWAWLSAHSAGLRIIFLYSLWYQGFTGFSANMGVEKQVCQIRIACEGVRILSFRVGVLQWGFRVDVLLAEKERNLLVDLAV